MVTQIPAFVFGLAATSFIGGAVSAQPEPAQSANGGQTVVCKDIPGSWALRAKITGVHLDYIDSIKDRIYIGGPVRGADGKPAGSIIVYATENLEEAKTLLANGTPPPSTACR